jgi:hypothetical protein
VSRTTVAVLAAASTLTAVVAAEVHGVMIGILTGCAAVTAGALAWLTSAQEIKKNLSKPEIV